MITANLGISENPSFLGQILPSKSLPSENNYLEILGKSVLLKINSI